jgi:hypothetical protein
MPLSRARLSAARSPMFAHLQSYFCSSITLGDVSLPRVQKPARPRWSPEELSHGGSGSADPHRHGVAVRFTVIHRHQGDDRPGSSPLLCDARARNTSSRFHFVRMRQAPLGFANPEAAMYAILVTVGTDGDVFRYVGLGVMLRARGSSPPVCPGVAGDAPRDTFAPAWDDRQHRRAPRHTRAHPPSPSTPLGRRPVLAPGRCRGRADRGAPSQQGLGHIRSGAGPALLPVVVFIDQFDNAARMKGLGAGDSLKAARWRIRRMVAALAV